MRFLDYITTAQTNLLRTKTRTFLTVLAFVIGTFTLGMVTAFTQGVRAYLDTQLSAYGQPNLVSVSVGKSTQQASSSGVPYYQADRQTAASNREHQVFVLNASDLNTVKNTAGVDAAYPDYSNLHVDYISYPGQPKYLIQVQPMYPGANIQLTAGTVPGASDTSAIILPYPYVEAFGAQSAGQLIGKTVTLQVTSAVTGEPKQFSATIAGILPDTLHQPAPYLSYQLLNQMVEYQQGSATQFSSISAFIGSSANAQERRSVKSALQSKGYTVQTYDDILSGFSRPLNIVTAGLTGFAAIALLAATIGIVNTLLMAVLERTQEIGLLKALGMRRRGITFIYLVEAASIGYWGGVIGVVLAMLAGVAANPILNRTLFQGIGTAHILRYPLPYMLAIIGGAVIIGLLAGTLPALRAGRLDPIEALRRE